MAVYKYGVRSLDGTDAKMRWASFMSPLRPR